MKKQNFSQNQNEVQNDEQKKFQEVIDQVLSVPKKEIDRREAEYKKSKGK